MHDDGDIGRPVHHVIAPDELPRRQSRSTASLPSQAVQDLIAEVAREYRLRDPERIFEIIRYRHNRHDVPRQVVELVLDHLSTDRRTSRRT